MGGGEVARYLSWHSGKGVVSAALVSSVVPFMLKTDDNPNGMEASKFEAMTAGTKEDRAKFFTSFFKDFFGVGPISHLTSDARVQAAWTVAMQAGLKPTLACTKAFATTDFRPELTSFRCPRLIIHGTADKTVPIDAAHCLDELSVGRTPDRARLLAGALALHPPLDGHGEPEPARRRRRPGGPRRRLHAGPVRAQPGAAAVLAAFVRKEAEHE